MRDIGVVFIRVYRGIQGYIEVYRVLGLGRSRLYPSAVV